MWSSKCHDLQLKLQQDYPPYTVTVNLPRKVKLRQCDVVE